MLQKPVLYLPRQISKYDSMISCAKEDMLLTNCYTLLQYTAAKGRHRLYKQYIKQVAIGDYHTPLVYYLTCH